MLCQINKRIILTNCGGGFGAKAASDRMTKASIDKIRDFIMSGVDPKSKNRITDEDIRMLMTSSASIEGG